MGSCLRDVAGLLVGIAARNAGMADPSSLLREYLGAGIDTCPTERWRREELTLSGWNAACQVAELGEYLLIVTESEDDACGFAARAETLLRAPREVRARRHVIDVSGR